MSAREASRGFSKLLDLVYFNAEEIVIERDGHPVAMLSPAPQPKNFQEFQKWIAERGPSSAGPEDDWQQIIDETHELLVDSDPWSS